MASASPPNFLFSVPVLNALLAPLALILSLLLLRWLSLAWAFRLPFVPARVSSSSSSPSVPTISPRSWTNHVFLSFRGEDTREKFVGHLYTALDNMGIHTFKDDKKLSLGDSINPSLIKAIKESQIAIIVFSENYADSSWCLNELVCIMECKKETGLIVVPIFYDVEPSAVRKQKQRYGEAFARYKSEKNPNLASWRKALVEACNISGQDLNNKANMDEAELIKNIVNKISKMVRKLSPRVNTKLVGLETRMRDLISKLQIGSDGVLMIGLWGVGGGGKTTLASSVYREISGEFDGCVLLENIREKSSKINGLKKLQEEILSGILKQDKVRVGSVEEGKDMIMDRLCRKKVLIVLDDVDQSGQLEALAGSLDWFGKGSRIIITTRDEGLLNNQNVVVQNITLLNEDEALRLFRKNAPRDDRNMEDYEQLSKEVVSYAGGLPLALTILGSFLRGKETDAWKSALARLKEIPNDNILETLKISFDGLTKLEQALFLDIACFHRWNDKDRAMKMLDACGFHSVIGVEVLIQKALITISKNGEIDMHDLVQEMGHHIVRGDHRDNPEKHSRVWKKKDVLEICAMDATMDLDMIEAVRFKYDSFLDRGNPLQHLPPIVANTKNLRRIEWQGDLASPLLTNFPQRTLRCLILRDSLQIQLWEGYKMLPNMKTIKLIGLRNLIMTPNFDGLPNLERFTIYDCQCLEEVHPSIGRLERLVSLHIKFCASLMMNPSITQPKNLKTLSLNWCSGIFECSEFQLNMDILPHNNMNHHRRLWLSHTGLTKLNLRGCGLGDEDIGSAVWELPNLQVLDLQENKFSRLDFSRNQLPRLKRLKVSHCMHLVELIELPSSIAVVLADDCPSLERFGDTSCCKWLWKVSHRRGYKLDPFDSERLLNSMLQGNAIEDYFIIVALEHQIPMGFVGSFFRVKKFNRRHVRLPRDTYPIRYDSDMFTLLLPDDWDNDFSGFLMRVVAQLRDMSINIIMKQDPDEEDFMFKTWQEEENEEDSRSEHSHESDEAPEPEYDGEMRTRVGYVSFSSLRRTTSLNSSYNIISFSIKSNWTSFSAELVPKRSKDDPLQRTKVAEFWDKKDIFDQTSFTIQQDSNSSIEIDWGG